MVQYIHHRTPTNGHIHDKHSFYPQNNLQANELSANCSELQSFRSSRLSLSLAFPSSQVTLSRSSLHGLFVSLHLTGRVPPPTSRPARAAEPQPGAAAARRARARRAARHPRPLHGALQRSGRRGKACAWCA